MQFRFDHAARLAPAFTDGDFPTAALNARFVAVLKSRGNPHGEESVR